MKIQLVENWRQWPRMYSTWAFGSIATIQTSAALLSSDILAAPALLFAVTWGGLISSSTAFLAISGAVGRLVSQDFPQPDDKEDQP